MDTPIGGKPILLGPISSPITIKEDTTSRPRAATSTDSSKDRLHTFRGRSKTISESTKDTAVQAISAFALNSPIPENSSFAYFRKTDIHPRLQRKILYALNQRHVLLNTVNPNANKVLQDISSTTFRYNRMAGLGSKINALLRSKKQKRTRSGMLHSLQLAVTDRQVIEALSLLDLLNSSTLIKKRPSDANKIFLNAMVNNLQSVCLLMLEKGFPTNVNNSIIKPANNSQKAKFTFPSYFQLAVALGLDSLVKAMLKHKADVNLSWYQITPLQISVLKGHEVLIPLLLQNGAVPSQSLSLGDYLLLHRLKVNGRPDTFNMMGSSPDGLLKEPFRQYGQRGPIIFSPEFIEGKDIQLFELALSRGHEDLATSLIENTKKDIPKSQFGLFLTKNVLNVRLLLQNGAQIGIKDALGSTCLHIAARRGKLDIVIALVLGGANINERGFNGWTPLHEAISYGHKEICHYLIYKSADISICTEQGENAKALASKLMLNVDDIFGTLRYLILDTTPNKEEFETQEKLISALEISTTTLSPTSATESFKQRSKFSLSFLSRAQSSNQINQEQRDLTPTKSAGQPSKRSIFRKASGIQ